MGSISKNKNGQLFSRKLKHRPKTGTINVGQVCLCVFLIFFFAKAALTAVEISKNSQELLYMVIESLKNVDHQKMAKGIARVEDQWDEDEERIIEFRFLQNLSRSDKYSIEDNKRGSREVVWSAGPRCYVGLNPYNAVVDSKVSRQFERTIGYDFHPETFLQIWGTPICEELETILKAPAGQVSIDMNNGILNIVYKYNNEFEQHQTISLDCHKEYRPVFWQYILKYPRQPEENLMRKCHIEWQKYRDSWFISSIRQEGKWYKCTDDGQIVPYEKKIKCTIEEFDPDVRITESEFTLDGIGVPYGTPVIDDITGITYSFGSGLRATEKLEGPLFEAEFAKSIKSQADTKDTGEDITVIDEQIESDRKSSISDEKSMQQSPADMPSQPTYRNVLIMVALFVGIVIVLVISRKLSLAQKGK